MSLYLKYRPQWFSDIQGNEGVVKSLQGMFEKKDISHTFLLHGSTGCGKTTIGRIIAKNLGCKGSDYKEVDTADFRGIDTVREIIQNSQFKPVEGPVRVWVVDECHKLTNDAQNAFLKILEDTPPHVYFVLCTTEPQKLLPTIRGRCSQFAVSPLNDRQMRRLLHGVVKGEEEKITKSIYDQIIQDSLGLPRNALQILEQVLNVEGEQRLEMARRSAEEQSKAIELCRALVKGESWGRVSKILNGLKGQDAESIRRNVLGYSQSVLLNGGGEQAAGIIEEFWEPLYNIGFPGLVFACYAVVNK